MYVYRHDNGTTAGIYAYAPQRTHARTHTHTHTHTYTHTRTNTTKTHVIMDVTHKGTKLFREKGEGN